MLRSVSILTLFALGEPGAWYDPSDLSTLFQDAAGTTPVTASGQPVGLMLDKSGRGNHATQATAASRPTYQTSGGLSYLAFDGVDDFMVTGTITPGTDKAQVFAGVRKLSDAAVGVLLESSASIAANNGVIGIVAPLNTTGSTFGFASKGTLFSAWSVSGAGFAAPSTVVLTGLGDIAADNQILRLNGAQIASAVADQGTGNYLAYPIYIGRRGGTSLPFNGNLYGLTFRFGANLTAAQIASTETYMAGKTGVVL
ncbi:hypothetical protein [Cypionkella sp.]|uniref:hypothetical protein n=1 Tax=Cypionkella sp. TaxID=2811411 RepID=UPI00272609A6|nr:hypothetical protein [Cypionkella sp.]MDO8983007.1 hypothetical protein [Cypionkella sp.]MDP2047550.1 hypothetical protein [Cypionkella sp.]